MAGPRARISQSLKTPAIIPAVKTVIRHKPQRDRWLNNPIGSGDYRSWLTDVGSLTQRLQRRCTEFAVQALSQSHHHPSYDEASVLQLPIRASVLHREVLLLCRHQPMVFAHSVLPHKSLRGRWQQLRRLGNRSLGSALFSNPQVIRTPLSYRKLRHGHALFEAATLHLLHPPSHLWARRSVFRWKTASILVTEVFLPEVIAL